MKAELFCLSEGASIKYQQLCIFHSFGNLLCHQFPYLAQGCLSFVVRFDESEEGKHELALSCTDADGVVKWASPVIPLLVKADGNAYYFMQHVLLQAELYEGTHEIALWCDGKEISSTLLILKKFDPAHK